MGLDMYAHATPKGKILKPIDFEEPDNCQKIFYWRKHNHLHGWFKKIYEEKGGQEEFNCKYLLLDNKDIDRLEKEYINLEPTPGFFFGRQSEMDDEALQQITDFIAKARDEFKNGNDVIYHAWY